MSTNKMYYKLSVILLSSQAVIAGEYVPPPTGPYQSSVVINKSLFQSTNPQSGNTESGNSGQVYKFPSDALIQSDQRDNSAFLTDRQRRDVQPQMVPAKPINTPVNPAVAIKPVIPALTTQPPRTPAENSDFSRNPWAPDALSSPDVYRGNWNYPQPAYSQPEFQQPGYQQQYPYGYNNQNNFMNDPFGSMPSPWSAMPMQPFFQTDKR